MKTQQIILLLALIILVPTASNAQFGNFIKNKASKALNAVTKEKVKETTAPIDSAAQKAAIDASAAAKQIEENQNKQNQNQNQSAPEGMDLSKLFGGKVESKYKDDYSFSSRLYMQIETYGKKETMKMDVYMYFSSNSPTVGMESKLFVDQEGKKAPLNSSMIMDGENKSMILLSEINGMKMGMISAIPDEKTIAQQSNEKGDHKFVKPNLTKTGNTRVIAGYTCDEYSYSDKDKKTYGKLWFTKDANLKIDKRGWQKTGMADYYGYSEFEGGIILANEAYDENGKLEMKSETKEIKPDFSHSMSVKGFTLRQMNFNQGQQRR